MVAEKPKDVESILTPVVDNVNLKLIGSLFFAVHTRIVQ